MMLLYSSPLLNSIQASVCILLYLAELQQMELCTGYECIYSGFIFVTFAIVSILCRFGDSNIHWVRTNVYGTTVTARNVAFYKEKPDVGNLWMSSWLILGEYKSSHLWYFLE